MSLWQICEWIGMRTDLFAAAKRFFGGRGSATTGICLVSLPRRDVTTPVRTRGQNPRVDSLQGIVCATSSNPVGWCTCAFTTTLPVPSLHRRSCRALNLLRLTHLPLYLWISVLQFSIAHASSIILAPKMGREAKPQRNVSIEMGGGKTIFW